MEGVRIRDEVVFASVGWWDEHSGIGAKDVWCSEGTLGSACSARDGAPHRKLL